MDAWSNKVSQEYKESPIQCGTEDLGSQHRCIFCQILVGGGGWWFGVENNKVGGKKWEKKYPKNGDFDLKTLQIFLIFDQFF